MNPEADSHLSRYNQSRADEDARRKAELDTRIANMERIGTVAKTALQKHIVPELEAIQESVRSSGLHGEIALVDVVNWQSNVGDSAREISRVRTTLELGDHRHELSFTSWITESAWKVRISIISGNAAIRACVPDEDFPGTDEYRLAAWARERAMAFLKAVFPL